MVYCTTTYHPQSSTFFDTGVHVLERGSIAAELMFGLEGHVSIHVNGGQATALASALETMARKLRAAAVLSPAPKDLGGAQPVSPQSG
jgi:hypothetical protein